MNGRRFADNLKQIFFWMKFVLFWLLFRRSVFLRTQVTPSQYWLKITKIFDSPLLQNELNTQG